MAFLTMYFSALANVNAGLITTIWSVNPVFMAIMDRICFARKFQTYHMVGTLFIVVCTVILSLSGADKAEEAVMVVKDVLPTWIPVLFGVVTPVFFTISGYLTKNLTEDRIGFDPSTLSFSAYFGVNTLILIFALIYWNTVTFSEYLFWLGMIGSIINTIGIVFMQNAVATGPAGPASALAAMSNLLLVVIEAVKNQQMLSVLEILSLLFGTAGAMILVVPD